MRFFVRWILATGRWFWLTWLMLLGWLLRLLLGPGAKPPQPAEQPLAPPSPPSPPPAAPEPEPPPITKSAGDTPPLEPAAESAADAAAAPIGKATAESAPAPPTKKARKPAAKPAAKRTAKAAAPSGAADAAGDFLDGVFASAFGRRNYKLFVPAGQAAAHRPLLLMLHGCKQTPADFAAGTRMNALAQAAGCLVLYPAQSRWRNPYGCWNWFKPSDQHRNVGEPALLASMVQAVVAEQHADASRVYVAGLSAGAAMAVNLVQTYPELFAAVGVHSGLAYGVAYDTATALQAMRHGDRPAAAIHLSVPIIVFHGDSDSVVVPRNADALLAQAGWHREAAQQRQTGQVTGGYAYTQTQFAAMQLGATTGASAPVQIEYWQVQGLGHAWSGGDAAGSFTDPLGPDASAQMLRFFLAQEPLPQSSAQSEASAQPATPAGQP